MLLFCNKEEISACKCKIKINAAACKTLKSEPVTALAQRHSALF